MNFESFLPKPAELYAQWKRDRELQCRMPLCHMWRGVLGLAMVVHDFDKHAMAIGDRTFLPNQAVSWIAVQDIPPGYFPISRTWNRFGVTLAMETAASLVYGFPQIDLSRSLRDAINLKLDPLLANELGYSPALDLLRDRRRSSVMLNITSAMTSAAYDGMDNYGNPVRTAWHRERLARDGVTRIERPAIWMPRAHAVFDAATLNRAPRIDRWVASHLEGLGFEISSGRWAMPFDKIAGRLRFIRPVDFLWDISTSARFLSCELEAFLFPPIQLSNFTQSQFPMSGTVGLTGTAVYPKQGADGCQGCRMRLANAKSAA